LEYVPTHGALLDPCHGNPPQTSLLFHKTSDGVARDRVIVKKRNLKTKADIDKIWTHVEGNKSIRLGKPGDAWKKEDGVHEPVVGYGISKRSERHDDPDRVKTILDEYWGGAFFTGAQTALLTDGWDKGTHHSP
jgi:hypothetical protein